MFGKIVLHCTLSREIERQNGPWIIDMRWSIISIYQQKLSLTLIMHSTRFQFDKGNIDRHATDPSDSSLILTDVIKIENTSSTIIHIEVEQWQWLRSANEICQKAITASVNWKWSSDDAQSILFLFARRFSVINENESWCVMRVNQIFMKVQSQSVKIWRKILFSFHKTVFSSSNLFRRFLTIRNTSMLDWKSSNSCPRGNFHQTQFPFGLDFRLFRQTHQQLSIDVVRKRK